MTVSALGMTVTSEDCVSLQVCIFNFEKGQTEIFTVKKKNKNKRRFCVKEKLLKKEKYKINKSRTVLIHESKSCTKI